MEYKYFCWTWFDGKDNTLELNTLLDDGWIPVRETRPSNPSYGNTRCLLILLSRIK